ncbi:hypothetical protein BTVI_70812 [Pitangus sulphuratus]|nr:hypothetical protein BTVI_70812 [Pitangus sulphuratus]
MSRLFDNLPVPLKTPAVLESQNGNTFPQTVNEECKGCSLSPAIHGPDGFIAKSPLTLAGLNLELLYVYWWMCQKEEPSYRETWTGWKRGPIIRVSSLIKRKFLRCDDRTRVQSKPGSVCLGNSLAEGNLGVPVDNKLNVSQL